MSPVNVQPGELVQLAEANKEVSRQLRRPLWWLRGLIGLALTAVAAIVLWAVAQLAPVAGNEFGGFADAVQDVEPATNEVILLSLILLFLVSLETREPCRVRAASLTRLAHPSEIRANSQVYKREECSAASVGSRRATVQNFQW
jgi:hypothetical protein